MEAADLVFTRRTRQNHAIEHATVTLLTRQMPTLAVSARSSAHGFIIFADLDLLAVREASEEAIARLRDGEAELAIHPNCGTNLAVGTSLAMVGSLLGLTALRPRTRIASAVASSFAGVMAARPLGELMQRRFTTLPDVRDVTIADVRRRRVLGRTCVEVVTRAQLAA